MIFGHFFCCSSLFNFSFGLSEDDAYVDKLPTFERHFDSFAGIVTYISGRRKGTGLEKGDFLLLFSFFCVIAFTQNPLEIKRVKVVSECF